MKRARPLVAAFLVWWAVLFWIWMLYVGEWNRIEWIAAASTATVAAAAAVVVHSLRLLDFRFRLGWARDLVRVPLQVVIDFGIVTVALARVLVSRRPAEGRFVARSLDAGGADSLSAGRRAFLTVVATYSPNAYVVDIDAERDVVLLHDLLPNRASEEPA
jgi:hypothetical protein